MMATWEREQTSSLIGWKAWRAANKLKVPRHDRRGRRYAWLDADGPFNLFHFTAALDLGPSQVYEQKSVGFDRGEVPSQPVWRQQRYLLPRALWPVLFQAAWHAKDIKWHWTVAFGFYFLTYGIFAFAIIRYLHYYMDKWGCLDEGHRPRQIAPDAHVGRVGAALWVYVLGRVLTMIVLCWHSDEPPRLSAWTYPRICLWLIVLDYYFYVVHRTYHQVDGLWKHHKLHHSVRHPTPTLAILSDTVQEFGEIWLIPLLAFATFPLGFHELYIANAYLLFVEAAGHAGIRAHWGHPLLDPILRPWGFELEIEDHDLHHRHGRGGLNYGKQTRIFDKIFGTQQDRVEGKGPPLATVDGHDHDHDA